MKRSDDILHKYGQILVFLYYYHDKEVKRNFNYNIYSDTQKRIALSSVANYVNLITIGVNST